jgi:hypothetical protein
MSLSAASRGIFLLLGFLAGCFVYGQEQQTLEQRQPLELVFADSIVPQDRHEAMFTTGGWYSQQQGDTHATLLTQKVEWGISDKLQVSTLVHALQSSNQNGSTVTGMGDFEVGARYTWATVRSPFTHIAVGFDAGFPTGNPTRGLGEGAYTVSPSLLMSQEFSNGKYQVFTTDGFEFVVAHRNVEESDVPHHSIFSNSGVSMHLGHGWAVGELSVSSNRWSGGSEMQVAFTPSYVWRLARRLPLCTHGPCTHRPSAPVSVPNGLVPRDQFGATYGGAPAAPESGWEPETYGNGSQDEVLCFQAQERSAGVL